MKRLSTLFQKLFPAAQVQIIYRESSTLTVAQWRTVPDMVKRAQAVLGLPDMKAMLDACKNSRVGLYALDGMPDITVRAIAQAQCEGYAAALNDIYLLGQFKRPDEQLRETFEPLEIPDA